MPTLRVAVSPTPAGQWQASQARTAFAAAALDLLTVEWHSALEHALLRGDADVALCWLRDWPPASADAPIVIAALGPRTYPHDMLLWCPEAADPREDFFLKKGAIVCGGNALQQAQISEYRPDWQWASSSAELQQALEHLRKGEADALLAAQADLVACGADLSGLSAATLHPRECTPAPGQGAMAYLTRRDDEPVRRLLQRIHQPAVSACTNVERRLLRTIGLEWPTATLGAFVERDTHRNFHLFAALALKGRPVRRVVLSHSTHAELAEQALERLLPTEPQKRT